MIVPIGKVTVWGKVAAVGMREGERYYMMLDQQGGVALMPASVVEEKEGEK